MNDYLKLFEEDIKEMEISSNGEFSPMDVMEFTERITNWFKKR
jgi:hypothetical protein